MDKASLKRRETAANGALVFMVSLAVLMGARLYRVDKERQELTQKFDRAIRGTAGCFWDWNLSSDKIWVSTAFSTESPFQTFDDKEQLYDLIHPEDLQLFRVEINRCIETEDERMSLVLRVKERDGNYRWARVAATNRNGYLSGFMFDVHAQQLALAQSQLWKTVVDRLGTGAFVVDPSTGIVLDWNRGAEDLTGWRVDEVRGKPLFHLLPPATQEKHRRLFLDTALVTRLQEQPETLQCFLPCAKGDVALTVVVRATNSIPSLFFITIDPAPALKR